MGHSFDFYKVSNLKFNIVRRLLNKYVSMNKKIDELSESEEESKTSKKLNKICDEISDWNGKYIKLYNDRIDLGKKAFYLPYYIKEKFEILVLNIKFDYFIIFKNRNLRKSYLLSILSSIVWKLTKIILKFNHIFYYGATLSTSEEYDEFTEYFETNGGFCDNPHFRLNISKMLNFKPKHESNINRVDNINKRLSKLDRSKIVFCIVT